MDAAQLTILVDIAILAAFLTAVVALQYAVTDHFVRMRLVMTGLFIFVVCTLTWSFWPYAVASMSFSIPALFVGILIGRLVGVEAAQKRLASEGEGYLRHFAHIHLGDLQKLEWWSVLNYYTVVGALVLINLVGLSDVLFAGHSAFAYATCAAGAFLIGTIVPYLVHLWSLRTQN